MADYSAIKTGIKTRLDTLSGLIATFDTVPDTVYPPVAVVVPRSPEVEYNVSMGNSAHNSMLQRFNFDVLILAGRFNSEYSQDALDAFVSCTGSVYNAIDGDRQLGGTVSDCRVTRMLDYGQVILGEGEYLAARFELEVYAV